MPEIQPESQIHLIPVKDIVIGERQRKNLAQTGEAKNVGSYPAKLAELTRSIKEHGLLHPIVITRDLKLVTGFTRLTAVKNLGWSEVPARFLDECDEIALKEIELEENLARADLFWFDRDMARFELHKVKQALYGSATTSPLKGAGWSASDTAASLDIHRRQFQKVVAVVSAAQFIPELKTEPSETIALKKIDRLVESIENQIWLIDAYDKKVHEIESQLFLGDCAAEMARIATDSVDLIITDPPYGTDFDSVGGAGLRTFTHYDDKPEAVLDLLKRACPEMRRVLKPTGHLYAFFGIQLYAETLEIFHASGFDPDPIPLAWTKNTGGTVDWAHRFAPAWEPILFCSGGRSFSFPIGIGKRLNVFNYPSPSNAERIHPNEKPVALLRELIRLSSNKDEIVLDPFCGSGSTLLAAKDEARRWIGIEKNPHEYDACKRRLANIP